MTTYLNTQWAEKERNAIKSGEPNTEFIEFDFGFKLLLCRDNSEETQAWLRSIGREDLLRPL